MSAAILSRRLPGYDQPALDAMVEELFCALPEAGRIVPGCTVLLKPNLLAKHAPDKGVTTHPTVVRAVARAVKRRGAGRVILADSPGGVYNPALMQSLYKVSGMAAVCEEEGLELLSPPFSFRKPPRGKPRPGGRVQPRVEPLGLQIQVE